MLKKTVAAQTFMYAGETGLRISQPPNKFLRIPGCPISVSGFLLKTKPGWACGNCFGYFVSIAFLASAGACSIRMRFRKYLSVQVGLFQAR